MNEPALPGRRPGRIRHTWIIKPVGDGLWTIGYRIVTMSGVPRIAEQHQWPTNSPPWTRPRDEAPSIPPNLERARRAFTARQALQAWRDENETIDENDRHPLQPLPRLHGFDPMAPSRARPNEVDLANVACLRAAIKSRNYSAALADRLGVTPERARKLVWEAREWGLFDGDEPTPRARALLDAADTAA